jgi:subtilase family serine protease
VAQRLFAVGALALLAVACPLAGAGVARAAAAAPRATVQSAAPVPSSAAVTSDVAPAKPIDLTVALTPSDPAALAQYAQAVNTPGSPVYHHFITVDQFAQSFGAGTQSTDAVRDALSQAGLTVGSRSANGLELPVSGTAAQVESAFATDLQHVTLADGVASYADTTAPTLPQAAAGAVQDVAGLDSLPVAAPAGLTSAPAGLTSAPSVTSGSSDPRAAGTGGPSSCAAAQATGANTAQNIASAYGLNGLWAQGDVGTGSTVALFELEPYTASDVAAYQSCYGTSASVTNVSVDGGASCGNDTECGVEDELDVEDVAGLVPGAQIKVYEGPNSGVGVLDTYTAIVQDPSAKVVSTSWGLCETAQGSTAVNTENTLFEEAAVQGQAVFAASGDSGADDCAGSSALAGVDDPASQPYVTGVGGTSLHGGVTAETVWNDGTGRGAGGGGVSRRWAQPSYQTSHVLSQSAITCPTSPGAPTTTSSCREVPDVSADADPMSGYAVFYAGGWSVFGGTSAAAPTWASLVALADSSGYCAGRDAIGFVNPVLYGLPAADFHDVAAGNNSYAGVSGYAAGSGYDMASGLGTPNGAALVPALCGASAGTTVAEPTPPAATTTTATPPATTTTATTVTPPTTTGPPVKTHPAPAPIEFVAPARRSGRIGVRLSQPLQAFDRLGLVLAYSARGLPAGLRIDHASGMVSGLPRRTGTFISTVLATDTAGNAQSVVVRWTIAGSAPRARRQAHHARAHRRAQSVRPRRVRNRRS